MTSNQAEKIQVLARVARALNGEGILWAVGASFLLYAKGIVDDFGDFDIMIADADAGRARQVFDTLGRQKPGKPNPKYATRMFLEYVVDGVEFDLMAGFTVIADGRAHAFSLDADGVAEMLPIGGVPIPLQSVEAWRTFYVLMDRPHKVALIDAYLARADS